MRVELFINGQLYQAWEFEQAVYYEPLCGVIYEEKEKLWARILETCKKEMKLELVICSNPHEFYYILPARIQPADIDAEEYENFLPQVIEIENRLKLSYE